MKSLFLWKSKTIKDLTISLKKTGGRNHFGIISNYHRGGGSKQRYTMVNFNTIKHNSQLAIIRRFEYDSNRKCYLCLICSEFGYLSYILAVEGMFIGQVLDFNKDKISLLLNGNRTKISNFFLGSQLSNIEFYPNKKGIFTRAAGCRSFLLKKYHNNVLVRLQSKQLKLILNNCLASFGSISLGDYKFYKYKKAGQKRWLGYRPIVRGVAMNPVDHPHGGGEGKTSGGRCSVSPWGILTKGYPTVRGKRRRLKFLLKF